MGVDQELDQRLRSATKNKQLLEFNYKGNDRVVGTPLRLRHSEWNRQIALLASRRTKRQRLPGWRVVDVASPEIETSLLASTIGGRRFYPPSGVKLRPSERRYTPYIVALLVGFSLGVSVDRARLEVGAGGVCR